MRFDRSGNRDHGDIEDEPTPCLETGAQIVDLVKQYSPTGQFPPAVNHLSLSMREGEITTLLGHNGAGTFQKWGVFETECLF